MKIAVLGSGVLGVTVAYELSKRGHEVMLVDRKTNCGAETSFANGGQLSYSHGEPWATPSVLPKLPKWMLHSDSPLIFRVRADWQMMKWGMQFLRNCTASRAAVNTANLLRLGLYSKTQFDRIRNETGIGFDYASKGILHIYGSGHDFDHAKRHNDFQAKFGCEQRVLTREECLSLEPALAMTQRSIVGGIHSFIDESGDAYLFCNELAKLAAERHGLKIHCDVNIQSLRHKNGMMTAVATDKGDIVADAYIMALGSYSPIYLRPLGIHIPVYPMKGYSITIAANDTCPNVSITDGTYKIVFSRLGSRLRVAGTAEFAGYDTSINEKRVAPIIKAASALFPGADWNQEIGKWACLRPSTPDGPPIIGRTPVRNLFLNTGHGTLGWTQAAGSAVLLADIMENKPPAILMHGLTLERYY